MKKYKSKDSNEALIINKLNEKKNEKMRTTLKYLSN